jgi:hypothetical protein
METFKDILKRITSVEERIEFEFEAKIRCDVESFNRYDPYQILDRETALKDDKVEGDSW